MTKIRTRPKSAGSAQGSAAPHAAYGASGPASGFPRPIFPIWEWSTGPEWGEAQKRHSGNDRGAKSVAVRASDEPVPDERREDHAGHFDQDDSHPGMWIN